MQRRLPLSRAFAQAGFSRSEAEEWRYAGFEDVEDATRWRACGSQRTPAQLHDLADRGFTPEQVIALDDVDGPVIDLRDSVLRNLHREDLSRWAASLPFVSGTAEAG